MRNTAHTQLPALGSARDQHKRKHAIVATRLRRAKLEPSEPSEWERVRERAAVCCESQRAKESRGGMDVRVRISDQM